MSEPDAARDSLPPQYARLFAPVVRLGWVFRDRWQFYRQFAEPEPREKYVSQALKEREHNGTEKFKDHLISSVVVSSVLFAIFYLLGQFMQWLFDVLAPIFEWEGDPRFGAIGTKIGVILAVPGVIVICVSLFNWRDAARAVRRAEEEVREQNLLETQDWEKRKDAHERDEYARVDQLDEWGAACVPADIRRIDIFGSSLPSWEAFLTVHGTSALAERPLVVVDLTREVVCRELAAIARGAQVPVDAQLLPTQLAETNLLSRLTPRQLVDTLIESIYSGDSDEMREKRILGDVILKKLVKALGDDLSMDRLAAGLGILMNQPDDSGCLTRDERKHIADELFTDKYREEAFNALCRLEAAIRQLAELGAQRKENGLAYLTCIALDSDARNVRSELLTDLIVQWLTHRIAAEETSTPSVIIAGADELARRHLERLVDVCERRQVRLTLMFRHLREAGLDVLGSSAVGFMRLINSREASEAADFIGRQHKFELSQRTRTLGGNETHTSTGTGHWCEVDGISVSTPVGWTGNWNKNKSTVYCGDGSIFGETRLIVRNWWSGSYSSTEGVNWSDAESTQRVYEYTVEPTVLQSLPDCTMLLVESREGHRQDAIRVKFNPAIITLPRVSTDPLPDLSLSHQASSESELPRAGYRG